MVGSGHCRAKNWHGIDYVHDVIIGQLDRQEERWKEVDGRLRLVLGLVGILFAAGGGFMRSSQPPASGDPSVALMPSWIGTAVIGGVALYLVAALVAIWGYRPQNFDRPPKPIEMRADYLTVAPAEAKRELIDTVLLAYDKNERTIARKFRAFRTAFVLATIATGAIGVALIGQIALQTKPWL